MMQMLPSKLLLDNGRLLTRIQDRQRKDLISVAVEFFCCRRSASERASMERFLACYTQGPDALVMVKTLSKSHT